MAVKNLKKIVSDPDTQISGFRTTRYEKLEVAYGTIPAAQFALEDVIQLSDLPSREIVYGKLSAVDGVTVIEVEIFPGTDLSEPIEFGLEAPADINYVIQYVRGKGIVGGTPISIEIVDTGT